MTADVRGTQGIRTSGIALGVALVIHASAAMAILRIDGDWRAGGGVPVEMDVHEPIPPPPEVQPPPEPPSPPISPKVAVRPKPIREPPRKEAASAAPPPPNQETPPHPATSAPPVFGVTMSSVVSGEAAMAVPVGNTTMTNARARPSDTPPPAYAAAGSKAFEPVPDVYIATRAKLLREIDSEDVYPAEARALGIEGFVDVVLDIDGKGSVVSVRILKRAGHGLDEAARTALKQFLFQPARTTDGRAVPSRLTWRYTFSMK